MPVTDPSIPDLLRERASEQPNALAYTFVDHDIDPGGFPESLTWSQVHRQAQVIAKELRLCGSPGDRAAILAPQGFDYIVAFLGALQAGFIAVPLSVPQPGSHDERVSSALRDSRPVVILTTSAVVGDVTHYVLAHGGHSAPSIIEVDSIRPRLTRHRRFGRTRGEGGVPAVHLWVDTYAYRCGHFAPECHRQSSTGAVRLLP